MESALGYPGEYVDHRVDSVVLMFGGHPDDPETVGDELAVEESVHEVDLYHYVDQTQELAHPILGSVPRVFL